MTFGLWFLSRVTQVSSFLFFLFFTFSPLSLQLASHYPLIGRRVHQFMYSNISFYQDSFTIKSSFEPVLFSFACPPSRSYWTSTRTVPLTLFTVLSRWTNGYMSSFIFCFNTSRQIQADSDQGLTFFLNTSKAHTYPLPVSSHEAFYWRFRHMFMVLSWGRPTRPWPCPAMRFPVSWPRPSLSSQWLLDLPDPRLPPVP